MVSQSHGVNQMHSLLTARTGVELILLFCAKANDSHHLLSAGVVRRVGSVCWVRSSIRNSFVIHDIVNEPNTSN